MLHGLLCDVRQHRSQLEFETISLSQVTLKQLINIVRLHITCSKIFQKIERS